MELFYRERRRVHAILYRLLGSNVFMEDLVQDAFLEIFRSLAGYRGEASLATWVDRCTVRVAYAHLSRRKPTPLSLEHAAHVPIAEASVEEQSAQREAIGRLYVALDRIDPTQRIAFVLHAVEGRPLEEVAAMMEATLPATKARVWRARQDLTKRARRDPALAAYFPETEDTADSAENAGTP